MNRELDSASGAEPNDSFPSEDRQNRSLLPRAATSRPHGGSESDPVVPVGISVNEAYQTLISTRNLEIGLFWQRSNYFLALNSALALGFFGLKDESKYALVLAVTGVIASVLWLAVCFGGKYWQTRWEFRLAEFEREKLPALRFFAATPAEIQGDVANGLLSRTGRGALQRAVYRLVAKHKPSVSYAMIRLAAAFTLGWVVLILTLLRDYR